MESFAHYVVTWSLYLILIVCVAYTVDRLMAKWNR